MFGDLVILQKAPQSPQIYGKGIENAEVVLAIYSPRGDVVATRTTTVDSNSKWKVNPNNFIF